MSAAPQLEPEMITLPEYELLPEERRAEVFEGVVYDMSSPSRVHQTILGELFAQIHSYLRKKGGNCSVFPAPFDVKLRDNPLTIVQPDLMVVCDKNKLDDKRCNGAPDFIIEIVSPGNPANDYIRKLYYYQKAGVREYWIVDPLREAVFVNYFEENIISEQHSFASTIKVNICDALSIDFADIAALL